MVSLRKATGRRTHIGKRMARYRRTARINEQLREEISLLIREEVNDPRAGAATITDVATSPELDHARIWITALGDEDEKAAALAGLQSAAAFIRAQLGRRLHIRRIPELHFEIDRKLENALRIESLLREALPGDAPVEAPDDPDGRADDEE
jgi:ribosome-binding factor A